MKLSGALVLVTGGAVRVGRAISLAFAEQGARVAVHYNSSAAAAHELVSLVRSQGGSAEAFQADLRMESGPDALLTGVQRSMGVPDVLVNSAAVMEETPVATAAVDDWERIMAVNLRAPWFLSRGVCELLRKENKLGVIVNIADLAAFESWPEYSIHGVSKAGVVAMTRSFARIYAPEVRVNCIAPGAVLLPERYSGERAARIAQSTPLRRIGTAEDVAAAAVYLATAEYVTGATLTVDGGRSVRH